MAGITIVGPTVTSSMAWRDGSVGVASVEAEKTSLCTPEVLDTSRCCSSSIFLAIGGEGWLVAPSIGTPLSTFAAENSR